MTCCDSARNYEKAPFFGLCYCKRELRKALRVVKSTPFGRVPLKRIASETIKLFPIRSLMPEKLLHLWLVIVLLFARNDSLLIFACTAGKDMKSVGCAQAASLYATSDVMPYG